MAAVDEQQSRAASPKMQSALMQARETEYDHRRQEQPLSSRHPSSYANGYDIRPSYPSGSTGDEYEQRRSFHHVDAYSGGVRGYASYSDAYARPVVYGGYPHSALASSTAFLGTNGARAEGQAPQHSARTPSPPPLDHMMHPAYLSFQHPTSYAYPSHPPPPPAQPQHNSARGPPQRPY